MKSLVFFFLFCVTSVDLCPSPLQEYEPLYAGTQLAFYPVNVNPGRISVQPYFSYIHQYGLYNSHWHESAPQIIDRIGLLLSLETGITDWLDISLYLAEAYQRSKHAHTWAFGDTSLYLGLQISRDQKHQWTPDVRLLVAETFPTGKYDRLNPNKKGCDTSGTGAYLTTLVLVLAKTFYILPKHPYNLNFNLYYVLPSNAKVHEYSLYGGSPETHGKVMPGTSLTSNLAIQCSLNRYWVLGVDIHYVHQNKTSFKGQKGTSSVGLPSSEQLSLAPCLEYSWNENFSAASGFWFSLAGRNSINFFGMTANIYCYF